MVRAGRLKLIAYDAIGRALVYHNIVNAKLRTVQNDYNLIRRIPLLLAITFVLEFNS